MIPSHSGFEGGDYYALSTCQIQAHNFASSLVCGAQPVGSSELEAELSSQQVDLARERVKTKNFEATVEKAQKQISLKIIG